MTHERQPAGALESRSQVLTAGEVFGTPLTAAAWKAKPSWGLAMSAFGPKLAAVAAVAHHR
jgi:hypothetical protein